MTVHESYRRFELATDPDAMRDPLRRGLERVWRIPVEVQHAVATRAFPRAGGAFTLQYHVRIKEAAGTRDLLLCGHLLGDEETWPPYVTRHQDQVIVLEDARLVVPVFPFDPKLKSLPDLVAPLRARKILDASCPGLDLGPKGARALEHEVLAYRLERRCVLRYRIPCRSETGAGAHHHELIAKIFRPKKIEAVARMTQLLESTQAIGRSTAPHLARTLAIDTARGIQFMEAVPGTSLHDLTGSPEFATGSEAAGRVLRALHGMPRIDVPPFTVEDELQMLDGRVSLTSRMYPMWASMFGAAYRTLVSKRPQIDPETEGCCIHRDFYDKQVLYAPQRTTVLDWDNLAWGDPAQDYGNFLAHVQLRAEQDPEQADNLLRGVEAFRRGYGERDGWFEERTEWWRAATLLRLAALYALRRRWRQRTPQLLRKSMAVFSETGGLVRK